MKYEDRTLVRLADPSARMGIFDQDSLARVVSAAYDTDVLAVEGPYRPVFDEFRLGLLASRATQLEGTWQRAGGAEITEARFRLTGMGSGSAIRVDGLWRGSIVAQASPEQARIVRATTTWPSLGADGPAHLQGTVFPGTVTVAFSPPVDAPPAPVTFPLAAAVLVRDADVSVAQLLTDSNMIRAQLEPLGLEPARDPMLRPRGAAPIIWMVPASVFDDSDWPGGDQGMDAAALRAARRAAAGRWLVQEGIALVTTD